MADDPKPGTTSTSFTSANGVTRGSFKPGEGGTDGWHSHQSRSVEAKATAARLRRFKTVKSQLLRDRGNDPTQAQITLADNAAGLAVWLEEQIAGMTNGKDLDIGPVTTAVNSLRRVLETLGIERKPKDVTTIEQYLAQHKHTNGAATADKTIEHNSSN
jgi:hypothetical protein